MDDELRRVSKVGELEPDAFAVLERYRGPLKATVHNAHNAHNLVRTALRIEQDAHEKGMATRHAGEVVHWARVASSARNVAVAGKAVLEGAVEDAETLVEERWVEFWLEAGNARRRKVAAMQAEAALKYGAPKGARS